ncbi:MAG: MaoC family dehydratase [Trueperaceae bacterium]
MSDQTIYEHPAGRYFEELEVRLVIQHRIRRTLTEADNVFFSTLTMNPQPLHLDAEYAAQTEFGKPLVNSLLTLSLLIGLSVHELTLGTLVANLGFEEINFPKPVFHGDTIHAESEVVNTRVSTSRTNAGIVTFEHRAFNQRNELVATCRRTALMQRKPTGQS